MEVLEVQDSSLEVPSDFCFPGTAYSIQNDFMEALFSALDNRALGIFESPTGTGKSLSLLCGSLTWLEKREDQRVADLKDAIGGFNEDEGNKICNEAVDWVTAQHQFRKKKSMMCKATRELKFIEDFREKRKKLLDKKNLKRTKNESGTLFYFKGINKDNAKSTKPSTLETGQGESIDEIATYSNDDFGPDFISDSDGSDDENDLGNEDPEFFPLKVIFASRTHSQLGQFANEFKKTAFATRLSSVTLGSRHNMCINSEVKRLNSLSLINERCLDLQKKSKGTKTTQTKKTKGCGGCEYFNHSKIEEFKNYILNQPLDIEDLVTVSKKEFHACPYYASRKAAKEAQLILLPYNTILHSGTRKAIGLKVQNSVLLLDEAHNIIESISNMYSTLLTESQLADCSTGLKIYTTRYMSRFNPKNLLHLKQIGFIIKSLHNYLKNCKPDSQQVFQAREFKSEVGIEEFDLFEILKFIDKSKLVYKLRGYLQLQEKQKLEEARLNGKIDPTITTLKKTTSGQALTNFSAFLKSLVSSGAHGRVVHQGDTLKFLLLNPSEDFASLVMSSRSIVLAGGTMKPYDEIEDQLFHSSRERIIHFSCNHIIPNDNLTCLALSHGPTSRCFDFTFKNRDSPLLLDELSRVVLNLGRVVPAGLIIFLPSYDYENIFHTHLKNSGSLAKIEQKKKVFREPKECSSDKVLTDYTRQIKNNCGGAILFAVVGGKLSEGINFSDDLGRCVLVVGLPYPNITSVEIKEKINFITNNFGSEKAKQFLPNACFKAINQSIGRSIRHSKDYSAIILLDSRFLSNESKSQLPGWIQKSYVPCNKFGQCIATLVKFFNSKNT